MEIPQGIVGQRLAEVARRAKYLLLKFDSGTLVLHLGMSGKLSVVPEDTNPRRHDHIDLAFSEGLLLRLNDPRRFGCVLWQESGLEHPLLQRLGPEPLSNDFCGKYLFKLSRKRTTPIKHLIMNSQVVVGVGNIYANESLFRAGIRPRRSCRRLTKQECGQLVSSIKDTLIEALDAGGTTLRDFEGVDGTKGYFSVNLQVYGRSGQPCVRCETTIKQVNLGQRQSVYCPNCQH